MAEPRRSERARERSGQEEKRKGNGENGRARLTGGPHALAMDAVARGIGADGPACPGQAGPAGHSDRGFSLDETYRVSLRRGRLSDRETKTEEERRDRLRGGGDDGRPSRQRRHDGTWETILKYSSEAAVDTYEEIAIIIPRGRRTVELHLSFLRLHGQADDIKIQYSSIIRLFVLPKVMCVL
uniref:FACT complex subunit SSRP1 n=1 Tax=Triticum urartu TaxID=4572 RepID=A0A8R7TS32_TRIUA